MWVAHTSWRQRHHGGTGVPGCPPGPLLLTGAGPLGKCPTARTPAPLTHQDSELGALWAAGPSSPKSGLWLCQQGGCRAAALPRLWAGLRLICREQPGMQRRAWVGMLRGHSRGVLPVLVGVCAYVRMCVFLRVCAHARASVCACTSVCACVHPCACVRGFGGLAGEVHVGEERDSGSDQCVLCLSLLGDHTELWLGTGPLSEALSPRQG